MKYLITGPCEINQHRPKPVDLDLYKLCDEPQEDLVDHLCEDDNLTMIKHIVPEIDVVDMELVVKFHVEATEKLSDVVIKRLMKYCQGQASDGWGEGYEQFDYRVEGVYVSPWFHGQKLTIKEIG